MKMYLTDCPVDWAMGVIAFLGGWGKTDLNHLVDHYSEVVCLETNKSLPVEIVHLAAVLQSGLPEPQDYKQFISHFPSGGVKDKVMDHLQECRRSYRWGGMYWQGWYLTRP